MNDTPEQQPPDRPGVRETLSAAAALMRDHPRETMLPLLAVQGPLVVGTILLTLLLYSTVFADEVYPRGGITGASQGGPEVVVLVVVVALALVLGLVGQGATIVSVGAIALGKPLTLSQALDPAFTRLGGLIALTIIFAIVGGLLTLTVVGIAAIPFLIARFGVTYQIYLLEDTGPIEALTRSWRTTHGNILRLLGIILVGIVLLVLIGLLVPVSPGPEMGPEDPFFTFRSSSGSTESIGRTARMAIDAGIQILQGGVAVPVTVFAHAALTLYYLRIREENS